LTHPHTSAGRLPTDEGYRYYINVLMKRKKLKIGEAGIIDKIYDLKVQELDGLLSETSQVMSDFTHYTSIVCLSEEGEERVVTQGMRYLFEHPEFHDLNKIHRILDALERKEELLDLIHRNFSGSTNVYIGKESNCPSMESCAIIVARYSGSKKREGRLALIGPKRMAYDEVIPLMEYISEAMARGLERY
jgi:heat-inducible transcriptional repressor